MIFEIDVRVGASEKAKSASEGFAVNKSIIDLPQKQKEKEKQRIS
jgi:hypothetical protein